MAKTSTLKKDESGQTEHIPVYTAKNEESVYTSAEFAAMAEKVFLKPPETVMAAFRYAGKTTATLTEARKIVNEFLSKEVK